MLRSEKIECVSLYCGTEGIRNIIERIGDESILELISEEKLGLEGGNKELENLRQKLKYLKTEINLDNPEFNSEFNHVEIEKIKYFEASEKIAEFYEKLLFLKNYRNSNKAIELQLEQDYKILSVNKRFTADLTTPSDTPIEFNFITAIFESSKKMMVKQVLKQRLRRNVYIKTHDTKLSSSNETFTVYILFALGVENQSFAIKIIEGLGGRVFESKGDKEAQLEGVQNELNKIKRIVKNTERQLGNLMIKLKESYIALEYSINREKEVTGALSKFNKQENSDCFTGTAWVLQKDLKKLETLKSFGTDKGRFLFELSKSQNIHPTHFETSKFAKLFQELTNVFGIPKYREINPAIFMIFTFPFLFGAMFGDILHGLILLIISLFMIFKFKDINGKCGVFQIILEGRFIVLACLFAAIWFGFLYGDFGSLPVELFKSKYEINRTYPFGIDPIWHHADNKMVFINSIKMKLSLIIGFAHMGLGAFISIANAYYFRSKIDLICVAVPQFIAFFSFLGYIVFLCVYKWLVTINRPSIVNTLISMYTDPFNLKDQMYPGQMYVQLCVVSFIVMTIPWMMLSKPLYMIVKKKVSDDGILDLWINSGIHTVEFCLGLISNTSSYLRLWAVSLAHVQLTSVLHEFTIGKPGILTKVVTFPVYISGTFMLLIGLEGLSACLHALRLNWIEFFSKFYSGTGIEFKPLNFKVKNEDE